MSGCGDNALERCNHAPVTKTGTRGGLVLAAALVMIMLSGQWARPVRS